MSFQERAKLGMEMLSKQRSFTLEEMRAQTLWIHAITPTGVNDLVIKDSLKMYYPKWTLEQIDKGCDEIKCLILKEIKWGDITQAIADYFVKASNKNG